MVATRVQRSTRFWLLVILGLMVGLDLLAFVLYHQSIPDPLPPAEKMSLAAQGWTFLNSALFETFTIGFGVAFLLVLVGEVFSVRRILDERKDRDEQKAIEQRERDRQKADEQKERQHAAEQAARRESMNDAVRALKDMFALVSRVRYYDGKVAEKGAIESMLEQLGNFNSAHGETFVKLNARFPEFKDEILALKTFFNFQRRVATDVANAIRRDDKKKDIEDLQNILEMVRDAARYLASGPFIKLLNDTIDHADAAVGAAAKEGKDDKASEARKAAGLETMMFWSKEIERWMESDLLLPGIPKETGARLEQAGRAVVEWARREAASAKARGDGQPIDFHGAPPFPEFRAAFDALEPSTVLRGFITSHGEEHLRAFALQLVFASLELDIRDRID
jgi:hypothetical protein